MLSGASTVVAGLGLLQKFNADLGNPTAATVQIKLSKALGFVGSTSEDATDHVLHLSTTLPHPLNCPTVVRLTFTPAA